MNGNYYTCGFSCRCPANGVLIAYVFELTMPPEKMVHVEKIILACEMWGEGFHEKIADSLFSQFGGQQTLSAHHHGVGIISRRGFV